MRTEQEVMTMENSLAKRIQFFNATARKNVDERNWDGAKAAADIADELASFMKALEWALGETDEL